MSTSTVEIETLPFNKASINRLSGYFIDYPVVYFLNNETTVYIGETVAVKNRMRDHLNNHERKSLNKMSLIIHNKFNPSAKSYLNYLCIKTCKTSMYLQVCLKYNPGMESRILP